MAHHHGSTHAHTSHGENAGRVRRALVWALVLNGAFLVIEATAGWLTGSLALLSDAAHMTSDVGMLALALGAAWLSRRPSSPRHSFGHGRAEVLGALVSGIALFVAGGFVLVEALERLSQGAPAISGWPVLTVGVIGLLINLGSAWYLHRADSGNLNVRGALFHMLADAGGSLGAIIAALFMFAGIPAADAVVSLLIALLVAWASYSLIQEAVRVLFEHAPKHVDPEEIRAHLLSIDGVRGVHDLHVWSLNGQNTLLSAHLQADPPELALAPRAAELLRRELAIGHSTIQIEPAGVACASIACPLDQGRRRGC